MKKKASKFPCECGRRCESAAGLAAHKRHCKNAAKGWAGPRMMIPKVTTEPQLPIKIDKHVPLILAGGKGESIYPFASMEVGDSILFPIGDGASSLAVRNKAAGAIYTASIRNKAKYSMRQRNLSVHGEYGFRVWRVK